MELIFYVFLLVAGFVMLIKGADAFVSGAEDLAGRLGIPQMVIGLTIVAMGTSAPEAAVSITAALRDNADITIGNVIGSNILNVLIILGLTGLITPIAVEKSTLLTDIPFLVISTVITMLLGFNDNTVSFTDALILLVIFSGYLFHLFRVSKKGEEKKKEHTKTAALSVIMLILGLVSIVIGSKLAVKGASAIGEACGLSQRFIGLTIVALGTSLPELFTSVSAARRGNADIAIGNIIGSNIFNLLFIVGLTGIITQVPVESRFIPDFIISIVALVILFAGSFPKKKMGKITGAVMLSAYCGYFIYLL